MGFNDCQENWAPAKRAIQILARNINRYYKDKKENIENNPEEIKLTDNLSKEDVLVPFNFLFKQSTWWYWCFDHKFEFQKQS